MAGLWVPVTRALRDHVMGIDRPSDGHSLPVRRASSAHFMGWFLGTILGKRIRIFSICSWLQFCVFVQCFMVIWWYFYRNYDTSMMLLCKYIWKCHFANRYVSVIYLQTMILWDFFQEKTFMCEDKGMGESASFVSGYSHHFPEKYRKLENNLFKACQFHFFLLYLHP